MKSHIARVVLTTITCLWVVALAAREQPATAPVEEEPPMRFTLQIEGKSVPVELDRPFQIDLDNRQIQAQLRAEPTRRFQAGGVSFEYPRHFAFEADRDDPNLTLWTLDGNDGVIMLMRFKVPVEPDQLLEEFVGQYGKGNVQQGPVRVSLRGQEFEGTRLKITLAGARLHQDVFLLPATGGGLAMIVQDSPDESGNSTDEVREVIRLLEKTFQFIPD